MRTIIIGGVAAGMSAATRLRRLDEQAEIVVLERGPYVSFANCGLPYYVGGAITDRSSLLLQTPKSLGARFRLDVRVHHEVTAIDRDARTVTVRHTQTGHEQIERYDHLIIATGAAGGTLPTDAGVPVHTLRTIDDVDAITALLDDTAASGPVIVAGAGFIGLEAVENLVERGLDVILVQRGAHVLSPLDPEMAQPIHEHLLARGVDVRTGTVVTAVTADGVTLSDGTTITARFVIDATGVRPATDLAVAAGLAIGATGGIAVDDDNRTSDPNVFAVGDGVEKVDAVGGAPALIAMAGLANRHGRTVADIIAGRDERNTPALGTSIVAVLGMVAAKTGWSEQQLVAAGIPHRIVHTHPASHATYYPGAQGMSIKLLVHADTDAILGAQIVGRDGVDKRIDVIAVAMAGGITASGLTRLELAYAPQFGSAKDPINQVGYVADNLRAGSSRSIQWHELAGDERPVIDVRTAREFAAGAIPGAINIPVDELRDRLHELPELPHGGLVVHCQVGQRGHTAARLLAGHGIDAVNLDGGYRTWLAGTSARAADRIREEVGA
ncbi:FAD-dependent oxidoreductase [Microbacterium sp. bgisy189]|uniref:FAD-dependent oxidoreductase n=1 Tax=Microbacterium sp. bgisy189 TaxID=3413798 RepID=UPI003EC10A02